MNEPTCIVMVGLPALGKSTHIKKLKTDDVWVYSTDLYIDAVAEDNGITYSEAFESNIAAATDFNEQKLKTMISLQKDIIWDQTNLGVGKRRKILNRMKQAGYEVCCTCIVPPETSQDKREWDRRLKNREGKNIPNHVLANMMESFSLPNVQEGFSMITFYNMYGDVLGIEYGQEP